MKVKVIARLICNSIAEAIGTVQVRVDKFEIKGERVLTLEQVVAKTEGPNSGFYTVTANVDAAVRNHAESSSAVLSALQYPDPLQDTFALRVIEIMSSPKK